MSLPLVKQVLRNSFWDYPAYVPRPAWEDLWLDIREVKFKSLMRRVAQKPALPLPRIWQGLEFDIVKDVTIGNGPETCTFSRSDKTCSIHFEGCRPFASDSNGIKIVE